MDKKSTCPLEGCRGQSKHLKHHAWEYHIPRVFWDRPWHSLYASPDYHRLGASCLQAHAKYLLGSTGTIQDLVEHVNQTVQLPREYPVMERTLHQMDQLTRTMRWPMADKFMMIPVNTPAVLIQWRILMAIVSTMSAEKKSEFRAWGKQEVTELEDRVHSRRVGLFSTNSESSVEDKDEA